MKNCLARCNISRWLNSRGKKKLNQVIFLYKAWKYLKSIKNFTFKWINVSLLKKRNRIIFEEKCKKETCVPQSFLQIYSNLFTKIFPISPFSRFIPSSGHDPTAFEQCSAPFALCIIAVVRRFCMNFHHVSSIAHAGVVAINFALNTTATPGGGGSRELLENRKTVGEEDRRPNPRKIFDPSRKE